MVLRSLEHPIQVGMSFGLASGVLTSLGLVVGLAFGTDSRIAVIGGIVTIAVADSLSDALGIHISEEAESVHTSLEIWLATAATFVAKFMVASSFLVPVLLFELADAVLISVGWGIAAVTALSWYVAGKQGASRMLAVTEHVGVAVLVVIASALLGRWVSATFA